MGNQQRILRVNTTNERALEQGARKIGAMFSDLESCLARRGKRKCVICLEEEWMDPGEHICWKCNKCAFALETLSHPLTRRSPPDHRALREVVDWMQDIPEGQEERSPQEIQKHLDELRASYTWSSGTRETKQDRYQNRVLNLLYLALHDMDLFFRRLAVVRRYYNDQLAREEKGGDHGKS